MKKPKLLADWDENRLIVIDTKGDKHTLQREHAVDVFQAGMRVYKKRGKK